MTEHDDGALQALWRASDRRPSEEILSRLDTINATHRRLRRTLLLLYAAVLLTLAVEEILGLLPTRGLLSVTWIAVVAGEALVRSRARRRLVAVYASARPDDLLAFTLGRAKAGLTAGRFLYLGTPTGFGVCIAIFLLIGRPKHAAPLHGPGAPVLGWLLAAAAMVILIVSMALGVRLARLRRRDIATLQMRAATLAESKDISAGTM